MTGSTVVERANEANPSLDDVAQFFDGFVHENERWARRNRGYHRLVESIFKFLVPAGSSVLEIGSGRGDLIGALEPSLGVGVDVSPEMAAAATSRHPKLTFIACAGEDIAIEGTFDYIIFSDVVPFADDLLEMFRRARDVSHPGTRVIIHSYTQLWRPLIRVLEMLKLKPQKPLRNWVDARDIAGFLQLAGFEVVSSTRRILFPKRVPLVSSFLNGVVANLWPFNKLCLTYWVVARPAAMEKNDVRSVSVIVPCRNEAGTIAEIVRRIPEMGESTELVFVEGGSTDDTRAQIERQIALHPERRLVFHTQEGRGKADAVRKGFAHASGDVVMIFDADMTVSPDDLPKFYDAIASGRAEFANGSRLVYALEPHAMQLLNIAGNKFFSGVFSFLIDQHVKDTLCGTKALLRSDYERIAAGRAAFGASDPFGDFDLLLGAARLGLKIIDVPVRYSARKYGSTNISRFRHGWLLVRTSLSAFRRLKVDVVRP